MHLVSLNHTFYVFTSNECPGHATRRAGFHYKDSERIGQRASIAELDTAGLIPATVHARSTITIFTKHHKFIPETQVSKVISRKVEIPTWIRKAAKDRFGSTITPEQLAASGADMWLSITEIRLSDLKAKGHMNDPKRDIICAKGHNYEWLCCGSIPESVITCVMPWDGKKLRVTDPGYPIRSFENSGQPWVFNWLKKMWIPDSHDCSYRTSYGKVHDDAEAEAAQ